MNLSMRGELAAAYTSGSQKSGNVTEAWGADNFYCPNCSSPKLDWLKAGTKASDYRCPSCGFWYQLKSKKSPIGSSISDGAYGAMMEAIRNDALPSFYFLHYNLATWTVRNLLLVPHFAFPPSAIVKRPPLSATAQRAGWVGCNFALNRIPVDARIPIVTTIKSSSDGGTECLMISRPEEVREKFQQVKRLKDVPQRGWVLDVLNIVRRLVNSKLKTKNSKLRPNTFTNTDIYAFENELAALHPDNRHIRDKIRQQLQVLRDTGFLSQPERGVWRVK